MVQLRTNNHFSCYTDSNGIVAWNEPGLMNREVFFDIKSPGYRFAGGGTTVQTSPGGKVELKIQRLNIAERLYRVTGEGIYRDSVLTGFPAPIRHPVLNGAVTGQDTVRVTPYRGKLFWVWGDTNGVGREMNFGTTGATSELPEHGGLDPGVGVDLEYFTGPGGFVKAMCPWPGGGLRWMDALLNVRDLSGSERLVARYKRIGKNGKEDESGLAVFNGQKSEFEKLVTFPKVTPSVGPEGHTPFRVRSGGEEFFYFSGLHPVPAVRVRADWESIQDLGRYEVFADGWKRSATIPPAENTWLDFETGGGLKLFASVQWNDCRKRWIGIVQGEKNDGQVWYAEADTPVGPWVYATRIVTHGKYIYYWPVQHPVFDQDGGRVIYFEGTYTNLYGVSPVTTPRYEYNQLMYRLSLDDPRLFLPAPVYRMKDGSYRMREGVEAAQAWNDVVEVPFFALPLDRRRPGTVPVSALFTALPPTSKEEPPSVLGEWDCKSEDTTVELAAQGDQLTAQIPGLPLGTGTLRDGIAHFIIADGKDSIDATASVKGGKLAVIWTQKSETNQATCERSLLPDQWRSSTALVPLYFADGVYSTSPRAGAEPVARVWRNPAKILLLDRNAKPVRNQ